MTLTSHRVFQYLAILLILGLFGGAYWYFKVRASTFNASQNAIDNTGLVGLWSFDGVDMTATTATDRSGQGNNGTLNGETAEVNGKIGQALHFDGSNNDNVSISDPGASSVFDFASTDPISMSFWIYPTAYPAGYGTFVTKGPTGGGGNAAGIFGIQQDTGCTTSCEVLFFYRNSADTAFHEYTTSSDSISLNTWHHVVVTYTFGTGSSIKIYVNGKLQSGSWTTGTGNDNTADTNQAIWIGANDFDEDFIGRIDDVRLYNRILAATEVDSLYAFGSGTHVNTSVSQNQGTGRLESGLVGYWRLDETSGTSALSSSTNSITGTLTNMEDPGDWTTGQIGGGLNFGGTDEYVSMAASTALDNITSMITISAWVKFTGPTSGAIVTKAGAAGADQYQFYVEAGETIRFTTETGPSVSSTGTITNGAWQHVAVTYDKATVKFYINGRLDTSSAQTGGLISSANTLTIGRLVTDNYMIGQLDEVRIYDRILSADEMAQLYRITTPTGVDTGLKGYWSFNNQDASGSTVYDRSGAGNTGTITNATKVLGKLGQALRFDGSGDYVNLGSGDSLDTILDLTACAWVNPSQTPAGFGDILSNDGFDGGWEMLTDDSNYSVFRVSMWRDFSGTDGWWYFPIGSVPLNTWSHVCLAYNYSSASNDPVFYVNGLSVPVTEFSTPTGTAQQIATTSLGVGALDVDGTPQQFFFGSIDEVRIYNRIVSASEIWSLAAQGGGVTQNSSISQPQGTGRLDSGVAGYWALDSTSGTSATDSSTNGTNGTLTNMEDPGDWTTGQIGGALDFDGSDEYVSIADNAHLDFGDTADFTLTGWFNRESFASDDTIVAKRNGIANTDDGYIAYIDDADDKLYFEVSEAGGADEYQLASTATFTAAGWNHFAIVWDQDSAANTEIYINGVVNNATDTGTIGNLGDLSNAVVLALAAESDTGNPFDGKLDETRLYSRALSASEITQLYRVATPTGADTGLKGYWSFNGPDISGTTAYDRSGAGNTGTLNGPTAKIGKLGQALDFDGTNDNIDVGDMTALEGQSAITISTWVKPESLAADEPFVNKGTSATSRFGMWSDDANGTILTVMGNGLDSYGRTGTGKLVVGTWTHVTMVFDGSQPDDATRLKVYVNGVQESLTFSANDIPATTASNAVNMLIANTGGNWFDGLVDEVRMYNRALSAAEAAALYNQGR